MIVAYINCNNTGAISNDAGGEPWTNPINEQPSGETARHALFWKLAGASEPSSYSWTLPSSTNFQVLLKVFSTTNPVELDAAANSAKDASATNDMTIEAIDGAVISDNALSVVFGGKDTRAVGGTWAVADNSYVGVIGSTEDQDAAGAHRIYTTGTTFSGPVLITDPGPSPIDATYSVHISFIEGAAQELTLTPSTTTPAEGDTVTMTIGDGVGPYTATFNGDALTIDSQNGASITVTWPDIKTFGSKTASYDVALPLVVTDTSDAGTGSASMTTQPVTGHYASTIAATTGIYADDVGVAVGDRSYGYWISGTGGVDLTVGALNSDTGGTFRYWLQDDTDDVWGTFADEVIPASGPPPSGDSNIVTNIVSNIVSEV